MTKRKSEYLVHEIPTETLPPLPKLSEIVLKRKKDDFIGASAELYVDGQKVIGATAFTYEINGGIDIVTVKILGKFKILEDEGK